MAHIDRIGPKEWSIQQGYMDTVAALPNRPGSYHIVTMGCQMNVRDSESLAGMMDAMGMHAEPVREKADLILYNTCCVRENAENKAMGNVIWLKELKKERPELLICAGGCMMQEEGVGEEIRAKYPFVDIVYGTHDLYRFPEYLCRRLTEGAPVITKEETDGHVVEGMPVHRSDPYRAFVNIMYGCNNFCSYCIVPYVRGRERSREPEDILAEIGELADQGVREVTLLGQNVNSYRGGGSAFAELLYRIDRIGIPRIRFMTSHPKDLSDELIQAYGELKHLMPSLHLPVQSGNDEILRQMNRVYDRAHYLELVRKLRSVVPEVGLTSDIIVGFPGETEEQFLDTLSLVREVRYDAAYTFIYSPRRGTRAARMPDGVPEAVKSERIGELIRVIGEISSGILSSRIGHTYEVLVEGVSSRDHSTVAGRIPRGHTVNFEGTEEMIGTFQKVLITSNGKNTLRGRRTEE